MIYDLQRAGLLKRISAFLLDLIILAVFCTGATWLISSVTGYDGYSEDYRAALEKYQNEYNISFENSAGLSDEEQQRYDSAYNALIADESAMRNYEMTVNLTFLMTTLGLFIGFFIAEFAVPLFMGNGQTVGKKIFGLIVVRVDGVKTNNVQMFIRSLLGKYTVETMVPLLLIVMVYFGILDVIIGLGIVMVIIAVQIALFFFSRNKTVLHDMMAGTAVADKETQMVFNSAEELLAYKQKMHEEKVRRIDY